MSEPCFDPVRFTAALSKARGARALHEVTAFSSSSMSLGGASPGGGERSASPERTASPGPRAVRALGNTVISLGRVSSTQEVARSFLGRGAPDGTLIIAEEQVSGRGRRGRLWESPPGAGIWATLILRNPLRAQEEAPWLTLAGALSVCEAARSLGVAAAEIKWPNDLVVGERKFGGVLGELVADELSSSAALLGIGVNIDLDPASLARQLEHPSTSLRAEGLPAGVGREEMLAGILPRLAEAVEEIAARGTFSLLERWRDLSPSSSGKRVIVEEAAGGSFLRGTTRGVAADGSLRILTETGGVRLVRFGGTLRFDNDLTGGADASRH